MLIPSGAATAVCAAVALTATSLGPTSPFAVVPSLLAGLGGVEGGGGGLGGGEVDNGGAEFDFGVYDPLLNGGEIGHGIGFGKGLEVGFTRRIARRGRERRGLAGVVRSGGGESMGTAEDDVKDAVGGNPCIGENSTNAADEGVPVDGGFVRGELQFIDRGGINRGREGGGCGVSHDGRPRVDPQWSRRGVRRGGDESA
ncbi:unnamed protein product [Closterium sp. NIES-64]|nr:unnamed protein product [Closterium sp. NIES-64]